MIKMTRPEKIEYIRKAMLDGYKSYFGVSAHKVSELNDFDLAIELNVARNWIGGE